MKMEYSDSKNRSDQKSDYSILAPDYEAPFILAIDQGTTSTRAIIFDAQARSVRRHEIELRQIYPANGWVEHDPNEIWQATLNC